MKNQEIKHEQKHGLIHWLAIAQGSYFLLTGIWPIVHIRSFLLVTGPKEDLWLVKTVGLLAASIGLGLLYAASRRVVTSPLIFTAATSALSFAVIDITYVAAGVIPPVYLLDAGAEIVFVTSWLLGIAFIKKQR